MRKVTNRVIVHTTDTPPSMDIGVKEITVWHIARKMRGCGYNYVIRKDGTIEKGRDENMVGAHCKGRNWESIGIACVGGWKGKDDRTDAQISSLHKLCKELYDKYGGLEFNSHNEFSKKSCPNYDAKSELSYIKDL